LGDNIESGQWRDEFFSARLAQTFSRDSRLSSYRDKGLML
jgi:hypothetical protein